MRLKKITILGFKSFADKTVLNFDSGITCIVGPNGCGKSNISDAFRWVLGEQSAKSMRGAKMPDVIFAGTTVRKPLNFAEVSLTLSDIQGALPIDYEEITLTRRLYRSGESEYLLNGNLVRLKDLQGLFLDSGVGRNAFSIFEQGKLDQVISFSPIERRYIFEEAAGILRFLQRKRESLKRLEQADLNLSRVKDIHGEIEVQVKKLEEQASKAVVYKENASQLEILEKACFVLKWQALDKKFQQVKDQQEEQKSKLVLAQQKESDGLIECHQMKQVVQEHRVAIGAQKEKLLKLQNQKEMEAKEQINIQQRLTEVVQRVKKLHLEFEDLSLSQISRKKTLGEIEEKKIVLESDWKKAEAGYVGQQDQVKHQENEVFKSRRALEEKNQKYVQYVHKNSELQSQLKQLEVRIDHHKERHRNLENRIQQLELDAQQIGKDIQERRQNLQRLSSLIDTHRDRLEQFEEEIERLKEEEKSVYKQIEAIRFKIFEGQARQKVLIRMRDDYEGFSSGSKALLKESENDQSPLYQKLRPLYEYFVVENEHAEKISTIMRAYSQTLIVNSFEDYELTLNFAGQHQLTDYSLICANLIKNKVGMDFKEKNNSLSCEVSEHFLTHYFLNSVAIASHREELLKLYLDGKCSEGWSADGHYLDYRGVFFKINQNQNQVFMREAELKSLEEELASKEELLQRFEQQLKQIQQKHSHHQLERTEIDKILRRDEMKLVEINFGLQKLIGDQTKNRETHQLSINEKQKLDSELQDFLNIYQNQDKEYSTCRKGLESIQFEKENIENELKKQEGVLRVWQQEQQDKSALYQQLVEDRQSLLHQQHLLQVQEQNHDQQVNRIEEELEELKERQIDLQKKEKEFHAKEINLESILKEAEEIYGQYERKEQEVLNALHQAEKQLHLFQDSRKNIEFQIGQIEVYFTQYEVQKQDMIHSVKERFGLELEELFSLPLPLDRPLDQTEKQVRRLRQTLQEFGDVNLTAIEELEKHQVRYSFIKQQMEDMNHSKEELLAIIQQLDGECRHLFRATFDAIRSNFKKNFQILFEGGEADLQLTDSEDILEAGIEISAKPPGKQMRSITLLSGGEKCLTAVALLFAIFEVKPAPFCILDEIDAPLDDTNVGRFVNVVKHFVDRCQFLIITHNKRTMAIADVIFGVSMEEKGVTKLLSLEFNAKEIPVANLV